MNQQKVVYIDASLLARSSCLLRVYYTLEGYSNKINNNDVEFGTAFHIFKSEFRKRGEHSFLIGANKAKKYFRETPMNIVSKKKYLTEAFLIKVCADYAEKYEHDLFEPIFVPATKKELEEASKLPDTEENQFKIKELRADKPLVELKFAVPYFVSDDLVIVLVGTIDELGKWLNGPYAISDTKTTSSWNVEIYFQGYELSTQLIFYRFILQLYAKEFPDSIFAKIESQDCGCFIDGVFYSNAQPTEFVRSKTLFFVEGLLRQYKVLLDNEIERIIYMIRKGQKPLKEGILNNSCSGNYRCPFLGVCSMPDDVASESILNFQFSKKEYQPLLFQSEKTSII